MFMTRPPHLHSSERFLLNSNMSSFPVSERPFWRSAPRNMNYISINTSIKQNAGKFSRPKQTLYVPSDLPNLKASTNPIKQVLILWIANFEYGLLIQKTKQNTKKQKETPSQILKFVFSLTSASYQEDLNPLRADAHYIFCILFWSDRSWFGITNVAKAIWTALFYFIPKHSVVSTNHFNNFNKCVLQYRAQTRRERE